MNLPGFRLLPEKGEPIPGRFAFCLPQGCFAEAELGAGGINALKKSSTASVVDGPCNLDSTKYHVREMEDKRQALLCLAADVL